MYVTLDQKWIIIDSRPAITLILGGGTTPYTIAFFPEFIKIPNYSSIDMDIHASADLSKALQILRLELTFQVGDSQLKAIRELSKIFDAEKHSKLGCTTHPPIPDDKEER